MNLLPRTSRRPNIYVCQVAGAIAFSLIHAGDAFLRRWKPCARLTAISSEGKKSTHGIAQTSATGSTEGLRFLLLGVPPVTEL